MYHTSKTSFIKRTCDRYHLPSDGERKDLIKSLEDIHREARKDKDYVLALDIGTVGKVEKKGNLMHDPIEHKKYGDDAQLKSISLIRLDRKSLDVIDTIQLNIKLDGTKDDLCASMYYAFNILKKVLDGAHMLICHNISFDTNVLAAMCWRYAITDTLDPIYEIPKYCTYKKLKYHPTFPKLKSYKLGDVYEWLRTNKFMTMKSDKLVINRFTKVELEQLNKMEFIQPKFHVSYMDALACLYIYLILEAKDGYYEVIKDIVLNDRTQLYKLKK